MEFEEIKRRLKSLGYEADASDEWLLNFIINKVEGSIKSSCNLDILPKLLIPIAIDIVCGEFFMDKKNSTGQLDGFDLETAVKSIQEGDTTVTFNDGSMTPEQRLNKLIDHLINGRKEDLKSFRCFKW